MLPFRGCFFVHGAKPLSPHSVWRCVFVSTLSVFAGLQSFLMSAGDIELYPSPSSWEVWSSAATRMSGTDSEIPSFWTRLEAGRNKLLHLTCDIQQKQKSNDNALAAMNTRIAKVEQKVTKVK